MDIVDRGTVGGSAQRVRSQKHRTQTLKQMGCRWNPGKDVAYVFGAAAGKKANPLERMFYGRDIRQRKKRGLKVGKTKRGKGTKLMVLVDGQGTPLGLHVDSASPSEMKLALPTIKTIKVAGGKPEQLITDRGYDSNKVRADLVKEGIEPIIPARSNNTKATHQDGRKLRKYRKRWIVERTNAWIQNYRRLVVRYERSADIYTGLVHMACALIVLRRVLG